MTTTPRDILSTLLPSLIHAAKYAKLIQNSIQALEEKADASNVFQAALSDADVTIQAQIEVVLLSEFPEIPFFGEEYKSSRNTRYLSGTGFVENSKYLITLDPIDGTRLYLDGQAGYQVILTVCSRDSFEGVLVVYPVYQNYIFALRGKGVFHGTFDTPFANAKPLQIQKYSPKIYVSEEFQALIPQFAKEFGEVFTSANYSKNKVVPYLGEIVHGSLCGGVMASAQVIDGAAFAFIAQELGCVVETIDGAPFPRPGDYPELVLPGLIIGENSEVVQKIRQILRLRAA